jgi:hypothetical protein
MPRNVDDALSPSVTTAFPFDKPASFVFSEGTRCHSNCLLPKTLVVAIPTPGIRDAAGDVARSERIGKVNKCDRWSNEDEKD